MKISSHISIENKTLIQLTTRWCHIPSLVSMQNPESITTGTLTFENINDKQHITKSSFPQSTTVLNYRWEKTMDLLGSILNSMDKPPGASDKEKEQLKSVCRTCANQKLCLFILFSFRRTKGTIWQTQGSRETRTAALSEILRGADWSFC